MPLQDANPTPSFGGFGISLEGVKIPRFGKWFAEAIVEMTMRGELLARAPRRQPNLIYKGLDIRTHGAYD